MINQIDVKRGLEFLYTPLLRVNLLDDNTIAANVWQAEYPVQQYPIKVNSKGFDKEPVIGGTLRGIKGQSLILDNAVVNMRKHRGYELTLRY